MGTTVALLVVLQNNPITNVQGNADLFSQHKDDIAIDFRTDSCNPFLMACKRQSIHPVAKEDYIAEQALRPYSTVQYSSNQNDLHP